MKANQHIEFLSNMTGQKVERFGTQQIMKASGGGSVMYKPIVYNQNVTYMNGESEKSQTNFLPDITNSAKSNKTPLKAIDRTPQKKNHSQDLTG